MHCMYCRYCDSRVSPEKTRCPACGVGLSPAAGSSPFQRISGEVEADHAQWREDWREDRRATEAVPAPGFSVAGTVSEAVSGIVSGAAASSVLSSLACAPPVLSSPSPQQAVGVMGPALEVEAVGMLNLLLLHAGFSPLRRLQVGMGPEVAVAGLEISAHPAAVLKRTIAIDPRAQTLDRPSLAPDLAYFETHDEAVAGSLEVSLTVEGLPPVERALPVTIQPANEWVDKAGAEVALAGAVTPNAPSVGELAASLGGDFMAYQAAGCAQRRTEVAEVYRGVGGLGLNYVGSPPSFEGTGQKVLFPDQVLKHRQACCLDIALLEAALLERLGYRPLIFFLRHPERGSGHALCGVWTADVRAQTPVLRDFASIEPLLAQGDLLLWNSTAYFEGAANDFQAAVAAGRDWMKHFSYALDIAACRAQGLKPVPRRRS